MFVSERGLSLKGNRNTSSLDKKHFIVATAAFQPVRFYILYSININQSISFLHSFNGDLCGVPESVFSCPAASS